MKETGTPRRGVWICVIVSLLLLGDMRPAFSAADEDWRIQHKQAIHWARESKFEQALPALARLQEKFPLISRIVMDRAVVLHWAGREKEATALYEAKICNGRDIPAYVQEAIADAYFSQLNYSAARPLYHALAATGNRNARLFEAEILVRQNSPAEAQKIYEALLTEKPDDLEVYLARGRARLSNGDSWRAIGDFETASVLGAKSGNTAQQKLAASLLATACIRSRDAARAIAALQPYIRSGQADEGMQTDYVSALCLNREVNQAIAEANRLWPDLQRAPVNGVRVLGDAYLLQADYEQAIRAFTLVLQREPQNILAMMGLAPAKIQKGQLAEAAGLYERVIASNAKLAEVALDDCLYYMSLGQTATAQRIFSVIKARIPHSAPFYQQYAERLKASGASGATHKNYAILRGQPTF